VILEKIKALVREEGLFGPDESILIAYSGGLDSTGLFELFLELRKEWPLQLYLAHFNHKIRDDSDKDEAFVRETAERKRIELFVDSADVPSFAKKGGINLEEAGRILRYDFLKRTAGDLGDAKIATGHTMTDQAETFLIHLLRGSGLKGLSGILPRRGSIIRPMLSIEREEIRSYLETKGVPFRCDKSNQDLSFLRNRIRAELLPYLREHFDPKIIRRIGRMASLARGDEYLLEELTRASSRGLFLQKKAGLCMDMRSLGFFHPALQRRLVRCFLSRSKGGLRGISFKDVERLRKLDEGKEIHLPGRRAFGREQGILKVRLGRPLRRGYRYSWDGRTELKINELRVSFSGAFLKPSSSGPLRSDDRWAACLDSDKLQFPLIVRNRASGDRYRPVGAPGRKKLKEIMRAKGIPPSERDRHPVFISGEEIVWVQGLPVSEQFKVMEGTSEVFKINVNA